MRYGNRSPEWQWKELWREWWETLDHIDGGEGAPWDPESLAVFLDVLAMGLRDLVPMAVECDFAKDLDLVEEVRKTARIGLARIEKQSGKLEDRRLPLETYTTEMILLWEWMKFVKRSERTVVFADRIRQIREESTEIVLDDRVVVDFICRLAGYPSRSRS
jgi:hypothetical protein